MQKQAHGAIAGFGRDPGRALVVAAAGVAAAALITAAATLGAWLLPSIPFAAVTLPIVLAYGAITALLVAGIVRATAAARTQAGARSAPDAAALALEQTGPELPDVQPNAFHEAYFFLRLQEEVREARRRGSPLCVVALDVVLPGRAGGGDLARELAIDLAHMAAAQARTISQPLNVSDSEFVFSLGLTGREEARAFMSKVVHGLGDYWCYFGIAAFPSDAGRPEELVEQARLACEVSRAGLQTLRDAA